MAAPLGMISRRGGLGATATVFQFYSGSKNAKPGQGNGESLRDGDQFPELGLEKDWRRTLSNFHESPFCMEIEILVDGVKKKVARSFASIEHFYQMSKFPQHPEFQHLFTLESESIICTTPSLAKMAGGKSGVSKGKILRPKHIKADPSFFKDTNHIMSLAQNAKYKQHPRLLRILLMTKDAKLVHFTGRGSRKVLFKNLMRIRDEETEMLLRRRTISSTRMIHEVMNMKARH